MALLIESAPAKINLTLRILGRRPDGYHALHSVVAFAGSCDVVALDTAASPGVSVSGPFAARLSGPNIVQRALELVALRYPDVRLGHVSMTKNLPVAAGLGGGSADAAAVLRLLRRANPAVAADTDWLALAAGLGADVPACLHNAAAFITGTGTAVTPIGAFPILHAVLVNTLAPVPANKTREVFAALSAGPVDAGAPVASPPRFTDAASVIAFIAQQGCNDLTLAAGRIMPSIDAAMAVLTAQPGCRIARLSGAGPTAFGVFDTPAIARNAAATIRAAHPDWWVAATTIG